MTLADAVVTGEGIMVPGVEDLRGLFRHQTVQAGSETFDPAQLLGSRGLRYKDRATKLALCAAKTALQDAGLLQDPGLSVSGETIGVVVSSNLGNLDTVCGVVETIARETVAGTSPMDLPNASSNVIASSVAIWFGLRGVNLMLCNGATSGLDAMHWAVVLTATARVNCVLVVGVETINPVVARLVNAAEGDPAGSVRPLDGAVALVVESADSARRRGARPVAAVGRYARRASLAESVTQARAPDSLKIGVWFAPERHAVEEPPPPGLEAVPTHDLSRNLGRCSGALGVLQCAAGIAWLASGGDGAVLATAGGSRDDATAAMILMSAGGGR